MTGKILRFELGYRLRRPATWSYMALFFLLSLLLIGTGSSPASEKVYHNAPLIIGEFIVILSLLGTLVASAIMGVPVYRDVEHHSQNFLFAYPIDEKKYLLGRYFGSFIVLVMVLLAGVIGAWLGTLLGPTFEWEVPERFGPNHLQTYLRPFLVFGVINMLFTGTLFFSLVALTRNVMAAYSGGILFLIAYLLSGVFTRDLDSMQIANLLDPYGLQVLNYETRYWTPFEQNANPFPVTANILYNRALWLGLSVLLFVFTLYRFSFKQFFVIKQKKSKKTAPVSSPVRNLGDIVTRRVYSTGARFRTMLGLAKIEFLSIVRDRYFIAMALGGVIFLFLNGWFGETPFGTPAYPTTFYMIEAKNYNFILFVWVILLFYTGEVVHRNRTLKFDGIYDTLPVPQWVTYFSKFLAMALVAFVLVNLVIVSGFMNQLLKGYWEWDFGLYFEALYLVTFPEYLQIVMLAFAVHVLVNQKFLGHFIGIAIWVIMWSIQGFAEIDYKLWFYGDRPSMVISDMNRLGHYLGTQLIYHGYWLAVGTFLLMVGYLFWVRGSEGGVKTRWQAARQNFRGGAVVATLAALLIAVGLGSFIYYNTKILNPHVSIKKIRDAQAEYEKQYREAYLYVLQPKYIAVKLIADLYPYERELFAKYETQVVNRHNVPIDTLFYTLPLSGWGLEYNGKALKPTVLSEPIHGGGPPSYFQKYALPTSLMPGDTALIVYYDTTKVNGFGNSDIQSRLTYNGTFVDMNPPEFGYNGSMEVSSDQERKKRDLPIRDYDLPVHTDALGQKTLLFNQSADFVLFEAIVSTAPDQIALAPGYLQREWAEGDRRYFHYKQDDRITLMFSIVSARYAVKRDTVQLADGPVVLEVYYHPKHHHNLERFVDGTRDAITYCSENYGPYQHRQMRVLEFPRYASFAQSFPNTVPFSEGFAWCDDFRDPNDYDHAYYVTAHEMAHQWWGHQVSPNYTRGSNLISESLAEYASLMVAKNRYGNDNMRKFMKFNLDRYLRGRANESKKENVFIDCNRPYQWYNKGSLLFFALQDYVGADSINKALLQFNDSLGNLDKGPYPGSHDLYAYVQAVIPDTLQYFMDESWHKITLYDNRVVEAKAKETDDKRWEVTLKLSSRKFYADSAGKETEVPMAGDMIDIGIFAKDKVLDDGKKETHPLYLQKHAIRASGDFKLTLVVDEKPEKVGIDPYNRLIDRIADDNLKNVDL